MAFAGLLAAAGAFAAVPSPANCTLGANLPAAKRPFISLVGSSAAGQLDPSGAYSVIVRDASSSPLPGEPVVIDFGGCCDMGIACDQFNAVTGQTFVYPAKVVGTTDAAGQFTFKVRGSGRMLGGARLGTPLGIGCAVVSAGSPSVDLGTLKVSTCDLDGVNGVSAADLSILIADIRSGNVSGVRYQRTDVNADGVVDSTTDTAFWGSKYFSGASQVSGVSCSPATSCSYTITTSAGINGSISPSGSVAVAGGAGQLFTVAPAACYHIADVRVDGVSLGAIASYAFSGVVTNHTLSATFAATPAVTNVVADECGNIGPTTVAITGGSFAPEATAWLDRAGETSIQGAVTYTSCSLLQASFDLCGAALGTWVVRVTNPDGSSGSPTTGFTIANAIVAVTPTKSDNTATCPLTVTGCGFVNGATVKLSRSGHPDIPGSLPTVLSTNLISAQFALAGQEIGLWDVVVTNPGSCSATLPQSFELVPTQCGDLTLTVTPPCPHVKTNGAPVFKLDIGKVGTARWAGLAFIEIETSSNVDKLWVYPSGAVVSSGAEFVLHSHGPNHRAVLLRVAENLVSPQGGYQVILRRNSGHLWSQGEKLSLTARFYQAASCRANIGDIVADRVKQSALQLGFVASWPVFTPGFAGALSSSLTQWLLAKNFSFDSLMQLTPPTAAGPQDHHDALIVKAMDLSLGEQPPQYAADVQSYRDIWTALISTPDALDPNFTAFELRGGDFYTTATVPAPAVHYPDVSGPYVLDVDNSADPNAKTGPGGVSSTHALNQRQPLSYRVEFANQPTATAPAQDVVITDQLDMTKLDLSTFRLGGITFGDMVVTPPPGFKSFSTYVDLRPARDILLWIDQSLDIATGLLTCSFRSRDPLTGLQPSNPLMGFLPPDVTPPEGEGSIDYYVSPLPSVVSGTTIANQARIVFDANPYIDTLPWTNLFDFDAPSSNVNPLLPQSGGGGFNVTWTGADALTGIYDFSVFVSTDGGPYVTWQSNTAATSATYTGQGGHTYAFYSTGRDSAGNVEAAPGVPDATTQVTVGVEAEHYDLAFAGAVPNPSRSGGLMIAFTLPSEGATSIEVLDIGGRVVARREVGALGAGPHRIDMARGLRLAPGIYHLRLERAGRVLTRKVAVLQ